jgi:hypothetical protein
MEKEFSQQEIEKALLDPAQVFESPKALAGSASIDKDTRIEILRRWEYDAREIQVEEDEAPNTTSTSNLLDEVLDALHQLGAHPKLDKGPPTKQGGV